MSVDATTASSVIASTVVHGQGCYYRSLAGKWEVVILCTRIIRYLAFGLKITLAAHTRGTHLLNHSLLKVPY